MGLPVVGSNPSGDADLGDLELVPVENILWVLDPPLLAECVSGSPHKPYDPSSKSRADIDQSARDLRKHVMFQRLHEFAT